MDGIFHPDGLRGAREPPPKARWPFSDLSAHRGVQVVRLDVCRAAASPSLHHRRCRRESRDRRVSPEQGRLMRQCESRWAGDGATGGLLACPPQRPPSSSAASLPPRSPPKCLPLPAWRPVSGCPWQVAYGADGTVLHWKRLAPGKGQMEMTRDAGKLRAAGGQVCPCLGAVEPQ